MLIKKNKKSDKVNKMFLRFVEEEDSYALLRWRNDFVTSKNSFNTKEVGEEEHNLWFKKAIKNPYKNIFIGMNEFNEKVGMIRFDQNPEDNTVEVNIVIAPEARGEGYGTEILRKGCETYFNNYPQEYIIARIKKGNLPSIRVFTKIGFIKVSEEKDSVTTHLKRTERINGEKK